MVDPVTEREGGKRKRTVVNRMYAIDIYSIY